MSCSRVLPRLKKKKRSPYPKYPTLGACRATKPHKRGHVHSPPTPWVLGVAWPCAWALCGHSEQVSTVFLAPHMSIHRHINRFSQKSGYFWSNFEKIISKSASKWDSTPLHTSIWVVWGSMDKARGAKFCQRATKQPISHRGPLGAQTGPGTLGRQLITIIMNYNQPRAGLGLARQRQRGNRDPNGSQRSANFHCIMVPGSPWSARRSPLRLQSAILTSPSNARDFVEGPKHRGSVSGSKTWTK